MPTFSSSLENAIHASLAYATQRNHELATLEHLLLALIDEPNASRVMRACEVSLDELRAKLTHFLENELDSLVTNLEGVDATPTTAALPTNTANTLLLQISNTASTPSADASLQTLRQCLHK